MKNFGFPILISFTGLFEREYEAPTRKKPPGLAALIHRRNTRFWYIIYLVIAQCSFVFEFVWMVLLDVESIDNSCHFIQRHNLSRSGKQLYLSFNAEKSVKDFKALTFLSRGYTFPWNDNKKLNALWMLSNFGLKKKKDETNKLKILELFFFFGYHHNL